jgi:hypothetical protein
LDVSRPRVIHLIGAAEKKLGYELSVTPKQRSPYKPVAQRREERESAWDAYVQELAAQLTPAERRRLIRIFDTSATDEELERRLRKRLRRLGRERRARERGYSPSPGSDHEDDWSTAVGELEAEFHASLAEDGFIHSNGEPFGLDDFVPDDVKSRDHM